MKKLYEKDEVKFAIIWIVAYCVIIGTLKGNFGDTSPWPVLGLAVFSAVLMLFVHNNQLKTKLGLASWPSDWKKYLYFVPMWILVTGNLWGGIRPAYSGSDLIFGLLLMVLVGFVEEMIFRAFLFRGMLKSMDVRLAIVISSVTFGMGHIVNLFAGQATLKTLVQIAFAIAWGFIFTMVYYKSGSLLPCIFGHSLIDVFSNFAVDNPAADMVYVISTIVISALYCLYLRKLETKLEP